MVASGKFQEMVSQPSKREKFGEMAQSEINSCKVVVVSKSWCPFCAIAIQVLQDARIPDIKVVEVDHLGLSLADQNEYMQALKQTTGEHRVPQLFVDGKYIGEYDDIIHEGDTNTLQPPVSELLKDVAECVPEGDFDFDLFVLGGGSGGCAAGLAAAQLPGVKVAVADYVEPSPAGTTWGVGGTCTNVGCIPKKLMHIAATMGDNNTNDSQAFGWEMSQQPSHSWSKMCDGIHNYIKNSLNEGMLAGFETNGVTYFNNKASLVDRHTLALAQPDGSVKNVTAKYIMLSAGGRPSSGFEGEDTPGVITSDDIFWLDSPPGKTLVVGAAYIALECGGMLTGMGMDVTV